MDVADWLRTLGLEQYEAPFRENAVDADLLPTLTADDLKDLGVTLVGHRRRLLEAIAVLRSEGAPTNNPVRLAPSPAETLSFSDSTVAERRPLSVMFCDLIGSTALSARLDPEDLREVIRAYQACVAVTIQQFDGFIARYVGDGVLIYFGWPEARETDAERAVRAGLAVAVAVSAVPVGEEPLRVRVGIATGLVVIGEPIGSGDSRQQTAVGRVNQTPHQPATQ
jgi:class 3 adenylate cyclase